MRQIFAQIFVFRVIAVQLVSPLERPENFLVCHIDRAGDHTRGLFEAEASSRISAPHALKNVKVLFFVHHRNPFEKEFYDVRLEKPTFCAVTTCVSVSGLPSGFTTTRSRTKIRQGSPSQVTQKIAKALSVTWPVGSSHRRKVWISRFSPPFKSTGGSKLFPSDLNWS